MLTHREHSFINNLVMDKSGVIESDSSHMSIAESKVIIMDQGKSLIYVVDPAFLYLTESRY